VQEIWNGLETNSQNKWPSLKFDVGAVNDRPTCCFSAGFYYKTFMWPKSFWDKVYEPVIRAAAGLGVSPSVEIDPDTYASRYLHCDVLMIGAGPAGLAAARAAAVAGCASLLADENAEAGGTLLSEPHGRSTARLPGTGWRARTGGARSPRRAHHDPHHRHRLLPPEHRRPLPEDHRPHGEPRPKTLPRERMWKVRAGQVVLAQGALEKPLVFDGNDIPGVMLAGAAQTYLNRYGVRVGDKPVVVTSHDSAYYAAFDLAEAGAPSPPSSTRAPSRQRSLVGEASAAWHRGADGPHDHRRRWPPPHPLGPRRADAQGVGAPRVIACDCLLMCGGWTPSLHLFSHTKGTLRWDEDRQTFLPGEDRGLPYRRRRPRPLGRRGRALDDGAKRGAAAARTLGKAAEPRRVRRGRRPPGRGISCKELPTDRNPGRAKPSSITRTTSPPRICGWPCARACAPSSTSSATPPTAWRPIRARCPTSTA
jgi:sarcosine oxidase subunit alpha